MPIYQITPHDLLMFRDGRPLEPLAGTGGHGARWPGPSIIFDALHAALHRAYPQQQDWEHPHRYGRSSDRDLTRKETQRFGSLATVGPFPVLNGTWLFPTPGDVSKPGCFVPSLLPLTAETGESDLRSILRYPLGSCDAASKEGPLPWWNKTAVERYLGLPANGSSQPCEFKEDDVFYREWTVGIGIDPETETAGRGVAQSQIYSAEYLRLCDGITLGIHAAMPMPNGRNGVRAERLDQLFAEPKTIIVGGQQRACQIEPADGDLSALLPLSAPVAGERVKWVLLSPAVFPGINRTEQKPNAIPHCGGWIPTWIADHPFTDAEGIRVEPGRVLLRKGDTQRGKSEAREPWRDRIRKLPYFDCYLVAARIPKPLVITGWTERLHLRDEPDELRKEKSARPTLLAVPAGAVYYFEGPDAPLLAYALSWHGNGQGTEIQNRRSTLMGEKGFGLGVCGPWTEFP